MDDRDPNSLHTFIGTLAFMSPLLRAAELQDRNIKVKHDVE
jgi:hypothetical protein